jgi:c(7)-type cytochrome triheme protein
MKIARNIWLVMIVAVLAVLVTDWSHGAWKKRPPHHEYGNVVIDNYSSKKGMTAVVFNHWLHRSQYTCRYCHSDLGFSLSAKGTKIREEDHDTGKYCSACHNGKTAFSASLPKNSGKEAGKLCDRCHSHRKKVAFEKSFYPYTRTFPRARFGNGINWIRAEKDGKLKVKDGASEKKERTGQKKSPSDSFIKPDEPAMPVIIFSHEEHAQWNGCDLCHPALFSEKKGEPKITMEAIMEGRFCGVCHGTVAFPVLDCQRCHTEPAILRR